MRLSSITYTRVLAFINLAEMNPMGSAFLPSLVSKIVERFQFQKFPTGFAEFDLQNGVTFELGYFNGHVIGKLVAFHDGFSIEGRSTTEKTKATLLSMLEWLRDENGLKFEPRLIKRWMYTSNLNVYSEADLTSLNPILKKAAQALSEYTQSNNYGEAEFRVTRIAIDYDRNSHKITQPAFTIEKLVASKFGDHMYFTECPMPDDLHMKLLEEIENGILKSK